MIKDHVSSTFGGSEWDAFTAATWCLKRPCKASLAQSPDPFTTNGLVVLTSSPTFAMKVLNAVTQSTISLLSTSRCCGSKCSSRSETSSNPGESLLTPDLLSSTRQLTNASPAALVTTSTWSTIRSLNGN